MQDARKKSIVSKKLEDEKLPCYTNLIDSYASSESILKVYHGNNLFKPTISSS